MPIILVITNPSPNILHEPMHEFFNNILWCRIRYRRYPSSMKCTMYIPDKQSPDINFLYLLCEYICLQIRPTKSPLHRYFHRQVPLDGFLPGGK